MSKDSRKGKSIVKRRTTNQIDHSLTVGHTIDDAFEHFISFKKTIGVRDRTMTEYYNLMQYFREWLSKEYPEVEHVDDITTKVLREYIIYLKEERFNERTQSKGLSPFTINVRIRFLKAFFNTLLDRKSVV